MSKLTAAPPSGHPSSTLPRFPELDGMRGIAVLMVFCHHVTFFDSKGAWTGLQLSIRNLCQFGVSGVDIFFVLSGFLITSILIRDRDQPAYYQDFYWKRILRVLPLYFVILALLFVFIPHSGSYVILAAVFLANFASVFHIYLVTPFWSLAVEEQFYVLWPTVVRRRPVDSVARFAITVAAGTFLLRSIFAIKGHYNYYLTFLHCDGLALGAWLACRYVQRERKGQPARADDPLMWGIFCVGLTLFAASFLGISSKTVPFAINIGLTGVTLLSCSIIGLLIAHTGARALAFLRSPVLTFFGLISYALYLIHLFVEQIYDKVRGPLVAGDTQAFFLRIVVIFAVSVGLSVLSRYVIELPALSLRRRVLSHPAPDAETERPLLKI